MKQIFKKISLEETKSRVPGILPALDSEWVINYGNLYKKYSTYSEAYEDAYRGAIDTSNIEQEINFLDFSDNKILSSNTNGNYGLIVSDIEIPEEFVSGITDYTDINVNIIIPIEEDYDEEVYYSINQITKKSLRSLKEKCEREILDDEGKPKTKGQYFYYYNRNIYSIEIFDTLWNCEISDVVEKSTLHKYLTYKTLKEWFRFFNEYYLLLRSGKRKLAYKDALEYYEYEVSFKTEEARVYYENYDKTFKSRGGKEFFDWVMNNCIPRFYINEYNDSGDTFYGSVEEYWGAKYLYYPDVIKWSAWLTSRSNKYKNLDNYTQCKESDDCCDCTDFFKRGGHRMQRKMTQWLKGITTDEAATKSASITIPISLSTSIDDIGEMSIFSNEYQEKVDYSQTLNIDNKSSDLTGGTVVHRPIITDNKTGGIFLDNNVYMIKEGGVKGYTQNKYRENVFNPNDWVDYTSYYINKYPDEFTTSSRYYAFRRDGEIVYNPTNRKMCEKYKAITNDDGLIVVDGNIIPIVKRKYVIYNGLPNSLLNGLRFPVDETADGLFFTQINDRTFYAVEKNDGNLYFNFKTPTKCSNEAEYDCKVLPDGRVKKETVKYKNSLYLMEDGIVELEINGVKHKYPKLDGYVEIDHNRYFVSGRSLVQFDEIVYDEDDIPTDTYKIADNGWIISDTYPIVRHGYAEILYPYDIYRCDSVTGDSESQLHLLKQKELLTDDLGNEMPGYYSYVKDAAKEEEFAKHFTKTDFSESYRGNSRYMQPYNGCQLDLYYKVGNVSSLSKNEVLTIDGSEESQYFDGNILESMKFFYTIDGVPYKEGEITLSNDMPTSAKTDVLGAIDKCTRIVNEHISSSYTESNGLEKDVSGVTKENQYDSFINGLNYLNEKTPYLRLYCEFTYYIGAILRQKSFKKDGLIYYDGFELGKNMNHGVKYVETDELVNSNCLYHLLNGGKYNLKYYKIIQNEKSVVLNDYNNQIANIKTAEFSMPIRLLRKNSNGGVEVTQEEFNSRYGFNQLNNLMVAPVFRKEFEFGISMPQIVKSDIYIDRGINKAFDKHLRLQEIKTMDALEQYQNGAIFNVIEN